MARASLVSNDAAEKGIAANCGISRYHTRSPADIRKEPPPANGRGTLELKLLRVHREQSVRNWRNELRRTETLRRGLAGPAVYDNFERRLLPLLQGAHARMLDRAGINKCILAAVIRPNEAESIFGC